jgi:hypothetical protein
MSIEFNKTGLVVIITYLCRLVAFTAVLIYTAAGIKFVASQEGEKIKGKPLVIVKPKLRKTERDYMKRYLQASTLITAIMTNKKPENDFSLQCTCNSPNIFPSVDFENQIELNISLSELTPEPAEYSWMEMNSFREPERMISLGEELIGINDFDYGLYNGMMEKKSNNDIKGYINIPLIFGIRFSPQEDKKSGVLRLAEAMEKYTEMKCEIQKPIFLTDRKLKYSPFIFIAADEAFELTAPEKNGLEEYLKNGGFILVDSGYAYKASSASRAMLRKMLNEIIPNSKLKMINLDHGIYHSCTRFDDGQPLGYEIKGAEEENTAQSRERRFQVELPEQSIYLEGLWIGDRLAAVYSKKDYCWTWASYTDNEAQLRMGVNLLVYALEQEGGIASKAMRNLKIN